MNETAGQTADQKRNEPNLNSVLVVLVQILAGELFIVQLEDGGSMRWVLVLDVRCSGRAL